MNKNQTIFSQAEVAGAWSALKKARFITLLTHQKPDGDGISACAALDAILTSLDNSKRIETIYPTEPEAEVKHSAAHILINQRSLTPELIVAFDTASYDRLYYPEAFKKIPLINIDHHVSNSIVGAYNFVDSTAASTCELLYRLLRAWCPDEINTVVSEALLFGILYDTQSFQTQSTKSSTLRIAADLIDNGVDLFTLKNEVAQPKDYSTVRFFGELLSSLNITTSRSAVWIALSQNDLKKQNRTSSDLYGFNNFLAQLIDIDIVAVVYETEDGLIKLSFRSRRADVNRLAQHFGGGGHKNAAGALCSKPLEVVIKDLSGLLEALRSN